MKTNSTQPIVRAIRARWFHPRTLGVMLPGRLVKQHDDGTVSVRFDIDGKVWRTTAERIREGNA